MRPLTILLLLLSLTVAGCGRWGGGGSGGGWFSSAPPTTLEPEGGYLPEAVDRRPLVAEVTALRLEPTLGGLIVRATGLPPFQEYWDADLVPVSGSTVPEGSLVYQFRLRNPVDPALRGPAGAREIEAAAFVSETQLRGIRRITVAGAGNTRSLSR